MLICQLVEVVYKRCCSDSCKSFVLKRAHDQFSFKSINECIVCRIEGGMGSLVFHNAQSGHSPLRGQVSHPDVQAVVLCKWIVG